MPELGRKLTCSECGTRFYDLGKPSAVCPRCGSAPAADNEHKAAPAKRRPPPVQVKDDDDDDELPPFDASDEEIAVPEDGDDEEEEFTDEIEEDAD